jgi:hypothetical protein
LMRMNLKKGSDALCLYLAAFCTPPSIVMPVTTD